MNGNIYDEHDILETSAARLTLGYTISLECKQAKKDCIIIKTFAW